jgi:amino acid adenylation domain-containing protein
MITNLPLEQEAIRATCFHPTGTFVEFQKDEIEQSIPARFESIVRRYPDRIAVRSNNQTLSYSQLNRLANRIARGILDRCGEGQEPVGLLVTEGAPMIAAILGVLKAGKFFVPMDPSFPRARIVPIAEDSQAGSIVTDNENLSLATELTVKKRPVINMDGLDADISSDNVGLPLAPDAFAYVIYTSGSTGEPKGIVQNHRNTLHVTMTYTNIVHICADDRVTLLFSAATSAGAYGIFRALLCGATLYPFQVKAQGIARLAEWLVQHKITIYSSVPTLFRHLCESVSEQYEFPHLRLIELLGEPVYKKDVDSLKRHFSHRCFLANWSGSTEAGVVRCHIVNWGTLIDSDILPAGYAVPDREVQLLDEDGREAAMGQVGEIAVRSRYLSTGYWRKPERTRTVFLTDRTGSEERIYLTGDMGRMLPGGCLLQLGRKDDEVKVRGQRVELAGIEVALLRHPEIQEAAVIARDDLHGDKRLIAYVVSKAVGAARPNDLREFLRQRFPDYMVPGIFVRLDALPLLPNGKVDRQALPIPDNSRPELGTPYVIPSSLVESELARIWAEILFVDGVGIHDNFFELGGHSLAATRVVSQVIEKFQTEIPLQSLFQSPTVAEMAAVITQSQAKKLDQGDLNRILTELESLSEEQAQQAVAQASVENVEESRK